MSDNTNTSSNTNTTEEKETRKRVDLPPPDAIADFLSAEFREQLADAIKTHFEVNSKGISQEDLAVMFLGDERGSRVIGFSLAKYPEELGKSFLGPMGGVYPPGTEPAKGGSAVTHVPVTPEFVERIASMIERSLSVKRAPKPTIGGLYLALQTLAAATGEQLDDNAFSQVTAAVHALGNKYVSVQGGIRRVTDAERAKMAEDAKVAAMGVDPSTLGTSASAE